MRRFTVIPMLALTLAYDGPVAAKGQSFQCIKMHGSVAPDVGHPTFRISPETPSGLLALQETDHQGKWIDPLPANVRRLFPTDQRAVETVVTGVFQICPLEPPRPHKLRLAKMVSAQDLTVRTDRWLQQNH
jgi:hypothetical protein